MGLLFAYCVKGAAQGLMLTDEKPLGLEQCQIDWTSLCLVPQRRTVHSLSFVLVD